MQKIILFSLTLFLTVACGDISSLPDPSPPRITDEPVPLSTLTPTVTASPTVTPTPQASPALTPTQAALMNWIPLTNTAQSYTISYPDFLQYATSFYENPMGDRIAVDTWSQDNFAIYVYAYADGVSTGIEFIAANGSDEPIQVAGQSVKKQLGAAMGGNGTLIHIGPVNNSGKSYMLIYSSGSQPATAESLAIFEQMVASFTFEMPTSPLPTPTPPTGSASQPAAPLNQPLLYVEGIYVEGADPVYYLARLDPDGASTRLTEMPQFLEPAVGGPDLALSPDGQTLAFSTLDSSLYTVNTNGSGLTSLIGDELKASAGAPLWSPDSTRLAFVGGPSEEDTNLYIINTDGSNLQRLTPEPMVIDNFFNHPLWLPHSERLLFVGRNKTEESDYGNVYTVRADGSDLTCLSCQQPVPEPPCCAWPFELTPSPGGLQVTYRWFDWQLYNVDVASLQTYPLATGTQPAWSPDSQQLAFAGEDGERLNLFVVSAEGSDLHKVNIPDRFTGPVWSPDGQKITFRRDTTTTLDEPQKQQFFIINADGSGLTQLSPPDDAPRRIERDFLWTPDGTQLIFGATTDSDFVDIALYRVNADGTNLTPLITTPGYKRLIAWLPN